MKKSKTEMQEEETQEVTEAPEEAAAVPEEEAPGESKKESKKEHRQLEEAREEAAREHDQYLRLAAEYDNFRKRTQREKDGIYQDAVADTVKKFLPLYDDLSRALQNETTDEAYKKGVEMIMAGLLKTLEAMDIAPFGEAGEPFDPNRHNAVMHVEDESLGENTLAEVFQQGFLLRKSDHVIRFAMVKVAN